MTHPAYKPLSLAGWGRYPVTSADVYRPERQAEVREIVKDRAHAQLIARGFGRSYGDAALNSGGAVVLSERLSRFLNFDEERGVLTCEAGTPLKDILDHFVPRGWFLPVTPGTKFPSIGGSFACD